MQDQYKEVYFVIGAVVLVFLVLSGVVAFVLLYYQKKRFQHVRDMERIRYAMEQELLRSQLETQEHTYHLVGEELHDNVGQLLSSAHFLLATAERSLPEVPEPLRSASETLGKAIAEMRGLSKSLNRQWLMQFNLVENLQAECQRINGFRSLSVEFTSEIHNLPLPSESQVMLFRVVQEAIQNAIKHSRATSISVKLELKDDVIRIKVTDNGTGISAKEKLKSGVGMLNMKHRTELLGGNIAWQAAPGGGTLVDLAIPVKKEVK